MVIIIIIILLWMTLLWQSLGRGSRSPASFANPVLAIVTWVRVMHAKDGKSFFVDNFRFKYAVRGCALRHFCSRCEALVLPRLICLICFGVVLRGNSISTEGVLSPRSGVLGASLLFYQYIVYLWWKLSSKFYCNIFYLRDMVYREPKYQIIWITHSHRFHLHNLMHIFIWNAYFCQ